LSCLYQGRLESMGWDMGADVGEKAEPWQGQTEGQVIRRRKNIQRAEPGLLAWLL